jgi:peptidoglycan/xylan/chitin deacetylase (PgdA/CDA1 family)
MMPRMVDPDRGRRRRRPRSLPARVLAFLALVAGVAALVAVAVAGGSDTPRVPGVRDPGARPQGHVTHVRRAHPAARPLSRADRAAEARAVRRVLRRTSYISVGSRRKHDLALTFDDGPGPTTRKILNILKRYRVPATFFVVGRAVQRDPAAVREELRLGDAIGNHTADHAFMGRLSPAAQLAQIQTANADLQAVGLSQTPLFRPPYGSFSGSTLDVLKRLGMLMVLWTVDTKDFSRPGADRIVYTALSGARAGGIELMHDGGADRSQTAAALPRIIRRLRQRGFHLVTIPQLLRDDPPPANQSPPHSLSGG